MIDLTPEGIMRYYELSKLPDPAMLDWLRSLRVFGARMRGDQ